MSAYEDARALMQKAQQQASALTRLIEQRLSVPVDLEGPGPADLIRAHEALEEKEAPPPRRGHRGEEWREEFEKNWPKDWKRKDPGWGGRKR